MDVSWYFKSEWGRDQQLRSQLEAQAAHSARTSARLRSQLTQMQGSMERRVSALAKAFDCYVELGDVREQLADLPSSAPVRRRARDAMATLRAGHNPTPLPEGQAGHWLGGAMNRVIDAVRRGTPLPASAGTNDGDPGPVDDGLRGLPDDRPRGSEYSDGTGFGAGDRVLTGSRDARTFEALALGSLGYGERAAASLPALLTTDGGFTIEQAVLFVAVMDGRFGDDVLPSLRAVMRGNLARSDEHDWADWFAQRARSDDNRALKWLAVQTAPVSELPEPGEGAQPIDGVMPYSPESRTAPSASSSGRGTGGDGEDAGHMLERLVTEMIEEGSPLERDLIHRAATLRLQIEDPDASPPTPRWDHDSVPVGQVVREAFDGTVAGTSERRELLGWILPHLQGPIDEALQPDELEPVVVRARTPGGSIEVGEDGPKASDVDRARATIAERHARPPLSKGLLVPAGILFAVGLLGLIGLGPQWWAIAALVVSAGLVGIALWQIRPGDRDQARASENREVDAEIESARGRVDAVVDERTAKQRDHQRLADTVRQQLADFDTTASTGAPADAT